MTLKEKSSQKDHNNDNYNLYIVTHKYTTLFHYFQFLNLQFGCHNKTDPNGAGIGKALSIEKLHII